jgi:hypothetical protein
VKGLSVSLTDFQWRNHQWGLVVFGRREVSGGGVGNGSGMAILLNGEGWLKLAPKKKKLQCFS